MKNMWRSAKPLIGYVLGALLTWLSLVWNTQENFTDPIYRSLADDIIVRGVTNIWIIGPVLVVGLLGALALSGVQVSFCWGMMLGVSWPLLALGVVLPIGILLLAAILILAEVVVSTWKFLLIAMFLGAVVVAWRRAERDPGF